MSAQSEDHQMEGVENPTQVADKGKGKVPELEDSADDDSSDESGVEDQAPEPEDEDTLAEIDPQNIVGSRTRGKNIDFAKAAEELGEGADEEDEEDEDFNDPDDEMKD
ncbi:Histone H2A.Z-specific chaperone CHZ1 [Kalmusia sp. IMI 367209]|nr:Histone H2A.Z-specific chaperone CHZ1 [Kalmusia sp. IMI 367209]